MEPIFKYISQLANGQRRLIDSLASDKGYSGAQGKIIHYLYNHENAVVYQKDIENVFGLRAPTATELLKSLENKDLIKRVPSKKDGRYKEIILTEKANVYKEDLFHDMELLETMITDSIDSDEMQAWLITTKKIIKNLEKEKTGDTII